MKKPKTLFIEKIQKVKCLLASRELESVMRSDEWKDLMQLASDDIRTSALGANSESDVAFEFDNVLSEISDFLLVPEGYDGYEPIKERSVVVTVIEGEEVSVRSVRKNGRIDSKYGNVVIEYKKPSKYRSQKDVEKAQKQAIEYLSGLNDEQERDYLAIVTDGKHCQFIEWTEGAAHSEEVRELDMYSVDRLVRSVIKLSVETLSSENLIKDLVTNQYGGNNLIYNATIQIYNSLDTMNKVTRVSYESWLDNFGLSHEDISQQVAIENRRRDLAALIGHDDVPADEEYKILFALQTATAIVGMLIAYKVLSVVKADKNAYSLKKLHNIRTEPARIELYNIANGVVSAQTRIYNLLELNCFSWIFQKEQWNECVYKAVNAIIEVLLKYENMPDLTSNTDDLFRSLYMAIIPTSIRHSLGEYYTPKWLAENVIDNGMKYLPYEKTANVRVLDAAAGSGTFPQIVILKKIKNYSSLSNELALQHIMEEVVSIDANVLAVILARVNYFILVASLMTKDQKLYIPVYIGDSTVSNSDKMTGDGMYFKDLVQDPDDGSVVLKMPKASLANKDEFMEVFQNIEEEYENIDEEFIKDNLRKICTKKEDVNDLTMAFLQLKEKGMISPSIITNIRDNFLLASIGKFDLIVGNPPWVDWKSLPSVHREKIKKSCVSRELFSGDGRTGGINLNVCALLTNISIENWLDNNGVMSVLMPKNLLFQQSYEGYRNLKIADGRKMYIQEIDDWEKSGHPFFPVQQLFATYIISENPVDYYNGIPAKYIVLKKGNKLNNISSSINVESFNQYFNVDKKILGQTTNTRTAFTYAKDKKELMDFQLIAGEMQYIGREGVEYYPQELQLFMLREKNSEYNTVLLETYKNKRSKYSITKRTPVLETKYLRPLIKGINITKFHVEPSEYIVAFPYNEEHCKIPIDRRVLKKESPRLYNYYRENKEYLEMQTGYSDSIIGSKKAEYYALARSGAYSHAPWYVVFRDNTKWVSAVVGIIETEWGGGKLPAFQNHCVSLCEKFDGSFITEDEAYYICGILNSHIVEDFMLSTSDKRTFKIRLPIKINLYNANDKVHRKISKLCRKAHSIYNDESKIEDIRNKIDVLYLQTI